MYSQFPNAIPNGVKYLTFGTYFDHPIINAIPNSVTQINTIPDSVTHLVFGVYFDHPMNSIPIYLEEITIFARYYDTMISTLINCYMYRITLHK